LFPFVVVGGGCTGVETVTEIHEFLMHLRRVALHWLLAPLFPANSALAQACAPECPAELCILREDAG
jgi:hypothetical protein